MSYPTQSQIRELFHNLETQNYSAFFARVADDVSWRVMGHHPLSGLYSTKADFQKDTLGRLGACFQPEHPIVLNTVNIVGGGENEWATVELKADGICKNGLVFANEYAWVHRYNKEGMIVEVRAYLDGELVKEALDQNEGK